MSAAEPRLLFMLLVLLISMFCLHHSFLLATRPDVFAKNISPPHSLTNSDTTMIQSSAVPPARDHSNKAIADTTKLELFGQQLSVLTLEIEKLQQSHQTLSLLLQKSASMGGDAGLASAVSQRNFESTTVHASQPSSAEAELKTHAHSVPATTTTTSTTAAATTTAAVAASGSDSSVMKLQCGGTRVSIDDTFYGFANAHRQPTNDGQTGISSLNQENIVSIRAYNTIKLSVHDTEDTVSDALRTQQVWEHPLMAMVEALGTHYRDTKQEMVFLDIGSNLGLFGMLAASYGHKAIFFEPVPATATHVCESIEINNFGDRTIVFPFGLSDKQQRLYLRPAANNFGAISLRSQLPLNVEVIVVDVTTLDTVFPKLGISPNAKLIIKVDVEGAEFRVFQGGDHTMFLPNVDVIFFENTWNGDPSDKTRWEWLKQFEQRGFKLYCCAVCETYRKETGRCVVVDVQDFDSLRHRGTGTELVAVRSDELMKIVSFFPPIPGL